MVTRREFTKAALTSLAAAPVLGRFAFAQVVGGVHLGSQSYSFRDLPRPEGGDLTDVCIAALKECGITECELFFMHVEPSAPLRPEPNSLEWQKARDALRTWRTTTKADHFAGIRRTFAAAGISIYAYNVNFNDTFTDAEIAAAFAATRALGAPVLSVSTTIPVAKRLVPFADRHGQIVAMHNHSRIDDPNECATLESFETLLAMSKKYRLNLDIGHFTAANYDAVAYIREHHDQITHIHLKDRKKNQGGNLPWGQGDTPIVEVLRMLKARQSPIRAMVEYEYKGTGTSVEEVKRCLAYAKQALA